MRRVKLHRKLTPEQQERKQQAATVIWYLANGASKGYRAPTLGDLSLSRVKGV